YAQPAGDAPFPTAFNRRVETRPAGAALVLGLALEQRLSAARADECARPLLVQEGAAARSLGAVAAHNVIFLGAQDFAPFGVGVGDGEVVFFHEILLE